MNNTDPSGLKTFEEDKAQKQQEACNDPNTVCLKNGTKNSDEDSGTDRSLTNITPEQNQMSDQGNVDEFWNSRGTISNDPLAKLGQEFGNPVSHDPAVILVQLQLLNALRHKFQGQSNSQQLQEAGYKQIRINLMRAHVSATKNDFEGVPNFLSVQQITEYHHEVFVDFGLPTTTFGASTITGTVWEAELTGSMWCPACDKVP